MKKNIFLIISLVIVFIIFLLYKNMIKEAPQLEVKNNSELVNITIFKNTKCVKCIQLDDYLKVYKKAGVKFWDISTLEYNSSDYNSNINNYNIKKLPFVVFSKELNSYKTISNSWDNTFWYKNNKWEYIPTDIIPPYFDLQSWEVKWLIDIIYIWDKECRECYTINDSIKIFKQFWLKFNKKATLNIDDKEALELIKKYEINTFPTVLLSSNMELYKNFTYFFQNFWTKELDNKYILRDASKIGLYKNN